MQCSGPLKEGCRFLVHAEVEVHAPESIQELRTHQRLAGQFLVDPLAPALQQRTHGDGVAANRARVAGAEQVDEEGGHLPCGLGLPTRGGGGSFGAVPLLQDGGPLNAQPDRRAEHHGKRHDDQRDGKPVPAHESAGPVEGCIAARGHGQSGEVALEVVAQCGDRFVALFGARLQASQENGVQVSAQSAAERIRDGPARGWQVRGDSRKCGAGSRTGGRDYGRGSRGLVAADHPLEHGTGLAGGIRPDAREQLVEQRRQREDVRLRADPLPEQLLRRGILGRDETRLRAGREWSGPIARRLEQLGDPEIQELHLAVGRDQDVGRLQVTVDDHVAVRVPHRVRHPQDQADPIPHAETSLVGMADDGDPLDVLHHEERAPVRRGAAVDQLRDAGVVE